MIISAFFQKHSQQYKLPSAETDLAQFLSYALNKLEFWEEHSRAAKQEELQSDQQTQPLPSGGNKSPTPQVDENVVFFSETSPGVSLLPLEISGSLDWTIPPLSHSSPREVKYKVDL